jgi:hypothetical protein
VDGAFGVFTSASPLVIPTAVFKVTDPLFLYGGKGRVLAEAVV